MKNKKVLLFVMLLATATLAACGGKGKKSSSQPASSSENPITSSQQSSGSSQQSSSKKPDPTPILTPDSDFSDTVDNTQKTYPKELLLNHRIVSVLVGGECKLYVIEQFNYAGDNLLFTPADPEIADIDENGVVHGLKDGETTILVSDKDNPDFNVTVPVIVSPAIDPMQAQTMANAFKTVDEETISKKIVDNEISETRLYKNGVQKTYNSSNEIISTSYDDSYFRIWYEEADIRVEDGSKGFSNGEWIFHVNEYFNAYAYHQTGDVKNYYLVYLQSYIEQGRLKPLQDILDNLFVSGAGVLTIPFNYSMLSSFTSRVGYTAGSSGVLDIFYGSRGENDFLFGLTTTYGSTASQDDEERYGIPYGTKSTTVQSTTYSVKNNRVISVVTHSEETYEYGGDQYLEVTDADHTYEDFTEESLHLPNVKDYNKVDTLFSI